MHELVGMDVRTYLSTSVSMYVSMYMSESACGYMDLHVYEDVNVQVHMLFCMYIRMRVIMCV
jgi:hypothetical protein